jgi:hypothetical protein
VRRTVDWSGAKPGGGTKFVATVTVVSAGGAVVLGAKE